VISPVGDRRGTCELLSSRVEGECGTLWADHNADEARQQLEGDPRMCRPVSQQSAC
jgi:hypothetical protein